MATYFNTTDLTARNYKTAKWIAAEGVKLTNKLRYSGRVSPCAMTDLEYVVAALEALECYTAVTTLTGTATSTSTTSLIDTAATFVTNGVLVGDTVTDTTTNVAYTVTAVVSETELTLNTGGDTITSADAYTVALEHNCLTEARAENLYDNISAITKLSFVPKGTVYETITSDVDNQTATLNGGGFLIFNGGGSFQQNSFNNETI
jgi:hypothetical protein